MGLQPSPVLLASLGVGLLTLVGVALGAYLVRRSRRPPVTLLDPNEKYRLRLLDKTTVNHNTKRFRFALPTAHHVLGLPVGCVVPWATLGVASVPPDIFSTQHFPFFLQDLSKYCS